MKTKDYNIGDWIVHVNYGIGQVVEIEEKSLGENNTTYYRVDGQNGTYWVPVNQADTDRIRPIASKEKLKNAMHVLTEKPQEIEDGYKQRQAYIKSIRQKVSLFADVNLVRDLSFLDTKKELSPTEQDSLEDLKKRLAMEWSVVMDINFQNALKKLEKKLSF
jgi:RNA polymerase-interacting CarD/CdnL/TRCF family regulator